MSNTVEPSVGDGSYDRPIETDFLYKTIDGKYHINRSGHIFNWTGPNISKPTEDNSVLVGTSSGETLWRSINDISIQDYGMVGETE